MPLSEDDWEDLVVSTDPKFRALMKRSEELHNAVTGIPLDQVRLQACSLRREDTYRR